MSERKYKVGDAVMQNPTIRKQETWWKDHIGKRLTVKQYIYNTVLSVNESTFWYKENQLVPYAEYNLDDNLFEI